MSARVRWQAPSYLISHADGRHVLELNELGYRIVLMLDGRRSAQDIASDLESRFSLPPRSVRAALESILKSLSRHEYLESNVG
jgi:hypothetical protein